MSGPRRSTHSLVPCRILNTHVDGAKGATAQVLSKGELDIKISRKAVGVFMALLWCDDKHDKLAVASLSAMHHQPPKVSMWTRPSVKHVGSAHTKRHEY